MLIPKNIIVLVGPPQSGKTTASKVLEERGYRRISASGLIGQLDDREHPIEGRRELIQRGEQMLRENGPIWFAERLIEAAGQTDFVVFDGIRPVATIKHIVKLQPATLVLYVKTSKAIRRRRYEQSDRNTGISYTEVLTSDVEKMARGIQKLATTIVNDGALERFIERLDRVIVEVMR